jgi:hypothetical protein
MVMPRNTRNWYMNGRIDGRSSRIEGGPQAKDGGFDLTINQREGGDVADGLRVYGLAQSSGNLVLVATATSIEGGRATVEVTTHRDKPGRHVVVHVGSETYSLMNTLDAETEATR